MTRQKTRKAVAAPQAAGQSASRGKSNTSAGFADRLAGTEGRARSVVEPLRKGAQAKKSSEGSGESAPTSGLPADDELGRRWIESAYQHFVLKRTPSTVHQNARLDADKALSAGEVRALKAVGFAASASTAQRAQDAREKMLHTYFDILHNSASAAEVARYLGVDVSRVRQRARERSLYAFDADGEHRFPLVQFEKSKEVPGLAKVLPELPADLTPIEFVTWFIAESSELGDPEATPGMSPRQWLLATGDAVPVIALARAY